MLYFCVCPWNGVIVNESLWLGKPETLNAFGVPVLFHFFSGCSATCCSHLVAWPLWAFLEPGGKPQLFLRFACYCFLFPDQSNLQSHFLHICQSIFLATVSVLLQAIWELLDMFYITQVLKASHVASSFQESVFNFPNIILCSFLRKYIALTSLKLGFTCRLRVLYEEISFFFLQHCGIPCTQIWLAVLWYRHNWCGL